MEESLPTFEIFCHNQDMTTLSADQEYVVLYRDIIRAYANFASADAASSFKTPQSQPMLLRWKDIGLQAMKSVVGSDSFAIDGASSLKIAMPVILQNLYSGNDLLVSPLQKYVQEAEKVERQRARAGRLSMQTVQSVDATNRDPDATIGTSADEDQAEELEIRVLALRCLEKVFTVGGNRAQIHAATALVMDYILRQRQKKKHEKNGLGWATDLLEVIVNWTPVQDRFIILLTITEQLIERPLANGHLESQLTLTTLIDWLLCSPMNLVGLSVVDTLIALLQHLLALLRHQRPSSAGSNQPRPSISEKPDSRGNDAATASSPTHENNEALSKMLRQELIVLLQKSIGDLATHIYYADQVSDMIRTIVSRLKPSASAEEASGDPNLRPLNANTTPQDAYFSFPAARESALKTIINILVVSNLRESLAGTGPDPRNRVPINVWESTPWLLRDPSRNVRNAYVDAFLSWLQLETDKKELKIAPEPSRYSKLAPPRGGDGEGAARRAVTPASQWDKAGLCTASTFLQLLHLTVYEAASDASTTEADIAVLHLLMSTMIENMGINAARYGLPVIMKLQTDFLSDEKQYTPTQMLQIGSLVHGYLWALVEQFGLEGTKVGYAILSEISDRKDRGLWLGKIQIPPQQLNSIEPNSEGSPQPSKDGYTAFMAINELVAQIESSYIGYFASPAASPPASPGRANPITPVIRTHTAWPRSALPSYVKEQMLSFWSREACLSALETEHSSSASVAARSRAGTGVSRNHHLAVTNGFKTGPGNSAANLRNDQPGASTHSFGGAHSVRRPSLVEPHSPDSGRGSTVRVNELRRVLSVIHPAQSARYPPRPELQRTFSSGESLVTDSSTASHIDVSAAIPPATHDGAEASKPGAAQAKNGAREPSKHVTGRMSDEIPRVPPVPSVYAVPGAFPPSTAGNGSSVGTPSRSLNGTDRPRTAPSGDSTPTTRQSRSRTRHEQGNGDTRGSSPLLGVMNNTNGVNGGEAASSDAAARANAHTAGYRNSASRPRSLGRRADVEKLLEGIVPSDGFRKSSAPLPQSSSVPGGLAGRSKNAPHLTIDVNRPAHRLNGLTIPRARSTRNGIGPPPY